jgi:hypothetical protein
MRSLGAHGDNVAKVLCYKSIFFAANFNQSELEVEDKSRKALVGSSSFCFWFDQKFEIFVQNWLKKFFMKLGIKRNFSMRSLGAHGGNLAKVLCYKSIFFPANFNQSELE